MYRKSIAKSAQENTSSVIVNPLKSRFYRPELDALRFFAFFGVFLVHGPRLSTGGVIAAGFNSLADALAYCLCLFFFLSSYLITELLLRERDQTNRNDLRKFYARRILRIWPLYYLGVAVGIGLSFALPHRFGMSHHQIIFLLFFVGFINTTANPMGVLWSISVEEVFYLIWPWLTKLESRGILVGSILTIPISLIGASVGYNTWYNPVVQFLFFGLGGMTALFFHERPWTLTMLTRGIVFIGGITAWLSVSWDHHHSLHGYREALVYIVGALGTEMIFLSIFNLPSRYVPKPVVYLGRISFGLYVFHLLSMRIVQIWIGPVLFGSATEPFRMVLSQIAALLLVILIAATSYTFFEKPFLRLKSQFH